MATWILINKSEIHTEKETVSSTNSADDKTRERKLEDCK